MRSKNHLNPIYETEAMYAADRAFLKLMNRDLRRYAMFVAIKRILIILAVILTVMAGLFVIARPAHARDLAVGDSIALGTGQALGVHTVARKNMGSCWIAGVAPGGSYDHVVISAGINDAPGRCVEEIVAKYAGMGEVVILPAAINSARAHVAGVAARYGARTVSYSCDGGCTKSNFHPGSYRSVASAVRRAWGVRKMQYSSDSGTKLSAFTARGSFVMLDSGPVAVPKALLGRRLRVDGLKVAQLRPSILPGSVSEIIRSEASKAGVPAELAIRIAHVESRGQCSADNGIASGVMQVKPSTARAMGVRGNLHDCRTGVVAGVRYLKMALQKAHGNWVLASVYYNGGLGARPRATHYSHMVMND